MFGFNKPEPKKKTWGEIGVELIGVICAAMNRKSDFDKATKHLSAERQSQLWDIARDIKDEQEFQDFCKKAVFLSA